MAAVGDSGLAGHPGQSIIEMRGKAAVVWAEPEPAAQDERVAALLQPRWAKEERYTSPSRCGVWHKGTYELELPAMAGLCPRKHN